MIAKMKCNMDCLNCIYEDCINNDEMTLSERQFSKEYETNFKKELEPHVIPELGMQRYIHNRPDKEAYIKARNAEYELKRRGRKDRLEAKRRQYLRHREDKIKYQREYYKKNREEIQAKQRAYYREHREEILARRRQLKEEKESGTDRNK